MRFLQFGLAPWMARLEQGLSADADLFPVADMRVRFEPDGLLRADIKTRYEAYRLARQGGWITGNEIRCKEGLPEITGGDELQQTPVGGAPNTPAPAVADDGDA
jgi:phage portal protein BeeE